jgi:hypothetical protein
VYTFARQTDKPLGLISSEEMKVLKVLDGSMSLLHLALCSLRSVKRKNTRLAQTRRASLAQTPRSAKLTRARPCERTSQHWCQALLQGFGDRSVHVPVFLCCNCPGHSRRSGRATGCLAAHAAVT